MPEITEFEMCLFLVVLLKFCVMYKTTSKHIGLEQFLYHFTAGQLRLTGPVHFFNHIAVTVYVTVTQTAIVWKVRCIFNRLGNACSEYYTPSKHLTVSYP